MISALDDFQLKLQSIIKENFVFVSREINMNSKCIIEMDGKRTSVMNSKV